MIHTIAAIFTIIATAGFVAAQDARQQFLIDYAANATAIRDSYTNAAGKYKMISYKRNGKPGYIQNIEFRYNFYSFLAISAAEAIDDNGAATKVAGVSQIQNSKYGFMLNDSGTKQRRALSQFTPRTQEVRPAFFVLCFPFANMYPAGRTYLDLAIDTSTRVISYESGSIESIATRDLTIEFLAVDIVTGQESQQRMRFSFAPEMQWVCVAECAMMPAPPYKIIYDAKYRYDKVAESCPMPRRMEKRLYTNEDRAGQLTQTLEIGDYRRLSSPLDDHEFTMTAFGLPEPEGLDDTTLPTITNDALAPKYKLAATPYRPLLWLGIVVVAMIVTFAVYFGLRRRVRIQAALRRELTNPTSAPPKE